MFLLSRFCWLCLLGHCRISRRTSTSRFSWFTCILRSNFSSTLSLLNCTPLSTFDVFCFCGMGAGAPSICISAKARLFCLIASQIDSGCVIWHWKIPFNEIDAACRIKCALWSTGCLIVWQCLQEPTATSLNQQYTEHLPIWIKQKCLWAYRKWSSL